MIMEVDREVDRLNVQTMHQEKHEIRCFEIIAPLTQYNIS